jgi:hypothetical protein
MMVEVGVCMPDMDPKYSSGGIPEKVHTFVGLFFGGKLDYFSVLYHSIGEISGKVKMLVKLNFPLVSYILFL